MEAHTTPPIKQTEPDDDHEFEGFDGWGDSGEHDFDIRDTVEHDTFH